MNKKMRRIATAHEVHGVLSHTSETLRSASSCIADRHTAVTCSRALSMASTASSMSSYRAVSVSFRPTMTERASMRREIASVICLIIMRF